MVLHGVPCDLSYRYIRRSRIRGFGRGCATYPVRRVEYREQKTASRRSCRQAKRRPEPSHRSAAASEAGKSLVQGPRHPGRRRRAGRGRRRGGPLPGDRASPTPTRPSRPRRRFVYYAGRQSELGTYYEDQNRESIPLDEMPLSIRDAVVAAENQTFWTDKGIDPKGIVRALFSNAAGNSTPGRVDDHPAVRQDPLPHPGAQLQAQDQGSHPLAEDPAGAEQVGDARGLPQHHLLRPRRLRHPGGVQGLLRPPAPAS